VRHPIDDIAGQVEPVQVIEYGHVKGCGGGAFFLIAANAQIIVVSAAISEAMDARDIRDKRR
jgi:hypothetical protein